MSHGAHHIGILHLGVAVFLADLTAGEHTAQVVCRGDLLVVLLGGMDARVKLFIGAAQRLVAQSARNLDILHSDDALVESQQCHRCHGDGAVKHGQAFFIRELERRQAVFSQHLICRTQLAVIVDLAFADIRHGKMPLHAEVADGAFARRPRIDIQIEHLADQIERFDADAGVPLAVVEDRHEHHSARLLTVERLADSNRVRAHDVFLQGICILGRDGIADVFAKAGGHAVDDAALLQEFIEQFAVGLHSFDHFRGKFDLGTVLCHSNEFFQRQHAIGDRHGLNASCVFDRHVHIMRSSLFI